MADSLEIVDVGFELPGLAGAATGASRAAPAGSSDAATIALSATVTNRTAGTLYVISDVRTLDYDPASRRLVVGFSEPPGSPTHVPRHKFPPRIREVPAGESAVLSAAVPAVLNKMRPSSGLGMNIEPLDVRAAASLVVRVAFGDAPFRPEQAEPSPRMLLRLHDWARVVEKTTTLAADGPPPPAGSAGGKSKR